MTRPQASFNGAATFRPRKVVVWAALSHQWDQLQWGRDLSAAEGGKKGFQVNA